jgi:hypothetical protein
LSVDAQLGPRRIRPAGDQRAPDRREHEKPSPKRPRPQGRGITVYPPTRKPAGNASGFAIVVALKPHGAQNIELSQSR